MMVPFLDLRSQYNSIKEQIDQEIKKVVDQCAFAGGPFVEKFERQFSEFCGCEHAIGVGSGTEALWLSLWALGVGPGDEVLTVPNTFIATAEAISLCGASPVFVDIDDSNYNLDPIKLEKAITNRSKAIIPVHLFGQMANMEPIIAIAKKYNLFVVEDACQAHGATYKGKKSGTLGDTGCFSFYPGKNLGAYGDAGAVITNNAQLAEKMRIFRDHGQSKKYHHDIIGWNSRMDGIQGAVLTVKLKYLDSWTESRRLNAAFYNSQLSEISSVMTPKEMDYGKHVYHVYAIRVKNRDLLATKLADKEIHTGIHYPIPIHLQAAYPNSNNGDLNVSEQCASELLSLPMFPELTEEQMTYVTQEIHRHMG